MSIGGGVHRAIERSRSIDCTAMQIFVKNNMQWFARPLLREEIKAFLDHAQRKELAAAFAHANYLINLAATNPQFHANSLRALSEELIRADQLELPFLVMHPGAHLGAGEDAGLQKIIASLDAIWAVIPKVKTKIALETTAGQGSSRRKVRASRRDRRERARTGAALRLPRHRACLRGGIRHRQ
jgi:deoxyribonuclease-4